MRLRLGPGPVFAYEWLTATRRRAHYAQRSLFVGMISVGMFLAVVGLLYGESESIDLATPGGLARFGAGIYQAIAPIELTLVLLAAPAVTAGAVCLDRSRGTLEHMLITDLSDSEIVLGKLGVRLIAVLGPIAATLPVLALAGLMGGIEPMALIGLLAVAAGCAVVGCSLAMVLSVHGRTAHEVLIATYMILILWIAAPVLLRFASFLATGSPWGIPVLDVRPWLIAWHPYVLALAPYHEPDRAGVGNFLGFLGGCLLASAALVWLAMARIRAVALRPPARAARRVPRLFRWPTLPVPALDDRPMVWREWHRSRPAGMMRAAWRVYAAIGLLCIGVVAWPRPWNGPPGELPGKMNAFLVTMGLLMLGVGAVSSLADDRARGGLHVILSTPVSTRSIVAAKLWASVRRAPGLLVWPAATTLILAVRFGNWANYAALLGMLLAYAAGVISLALTIAIWVSRPGRAIALFVTTYFVLVIAAFCLTGILLALGWRHGALFCLVGNPMTGPHLLTLGVAQAGIRNVSGLAFGDFALGAYLWIAVYLAAARLLYSEACFGFDECVGRIPDHGARPTHRRPGPSPPLADGRLVPVPSHTDGNEIPAGEHSMEKPSPPY